MSTVIHYSLGTIGSYLVMLGAAINAASAVVLVDDSVGSPRSVGLALGGLLSVIGMYLLAKAHTTPPFQAKQNFMDKLLQSPAFGQFMASMFKGEDVQEEDGDAQTDQPTPQPS